ncbi:hypothetical protein N7537_005794 [Penicillium hordei]|uniref:Uncharacterized protein n=1 Tax=Penicillium hordei TaxID=40994 RepID=A0AAD6E6S0_9EURO|nr:uncharacterized protein N7537_005794 [Penicillium hordei]KAJ5602838.1 hypothetical protein N7537_005794 [Penicillium hordei]
MVRCTTRGTLSGREAFPTRVFLLVGFNEASISRQLKTISWKHGRLNTAVWEWKESVGGIESVEHEEEKGMATRATR